MQAQRINELQRRLLDKTSASQEPQRRPRLALHQSSALERGPGRHDLSALNPEKKEAADAAIRELQSQKPKAQEHRFPSGVVVTVPGLSDAAHQSIQRVFARVSPEQQAELQHVGSALATELYSGVPVGATDATGAPLEQHNSETYEQHVLTEVHDSYHDMIDETIHAGMYGVEKNLYDFFAGVQQKQNSASDVRADLAELQEMIADWPDDGSSQSFSYHEVTINDDGTFEVHERNVTLTKEQAIALANSMQLDLDSIGDISMSDQFKLQRMVEQYQEGLNAFSNILKQQDEVMRGTVQNIKA